MLPNIRVSYVNSFTSMHDQKEALAGETIYVESFIYGISSPVTNREHNREQMKGTQ